ncbi:hypothetical protein AX774_g4057 [Zancudomyces culisetae]|uniref:Yeast cell wall synthesis Kre9/Knh1-like N-terminal domain-containing protein n=1 Tax=Zancudomyces culisetae TaxID=1213189 RepID=A0A1R1PNC5_ZANCU|nr:hypothetical protein AX774_g4057 [Zancudomyces culisetae]|eukprot:OMH82460.1 hypothetical protein AX774_g4057 [Zancudomyces culisetae]
MISSRVLAVLALVANVFASIQITMPIGSSRWTPGSDGVVTWVQEPLKGNIIIDLMEGADSGNLNLVYTISESADSSTRKYKFKVPDDLPTSKYYSVRITNEEGDQSYSPVFNINGSPGKSSNNKSDSDDNKGKKPADNKDKDSKGKSSSSSSSTENESASNDSKKRVASDSQVSSDKSASSGGDSSSGSYDGSSNVGSKNRNASADVAISESCRLGLSGSFMFILLAVKLLF